jgi:hypothetical protein
MPPRRAATLVLASVVALAGAACTSPGTASPGVASPSPVAPGVDPVALEVLLANGHTATGATTGTPVLVGDVREVPWALYLEVSRQAGLDFTAAQGRPGTLLRTPIRGSEPDSQSFVLVVDGRVAGAWIGPGGSSSGVLPIDARP